MMKLENVQDEQEETNNLFSEFEEDTDKIIENLEEDAELKHEIGLDCWCYRNGKGKELIAKHWIQSIDIHGYTCGAVWNDDGSIFCWLCMIDEYDNDIPIHHTIAPMHTNEEFIKHILFNHHKKGKTLSDYSSRLLYASPRWK